MNEAHTKDGQSIPDEWDEWDEYEEAGPMDLEDQLDRLMENSHDRSNHDHC